MNLPGEFHSSAQCGAGQNHVRQSRERLDMSETAQEQIGPEHKPVPIHVPISKFEPEMYVEGTYLLFDAQVKANSRNNGSRTTFRLVDRSGSVAGVSFRCSAPDSKCPVFICGTVGEFNGELQITVTSMQPDTGVDVGSLMPCSVRPAGEMLSDLLRHVASTRP